MNHSVFSVSRKHSAKGSTFGAAVDSGRLRLARLGRLTIGRFLASGQVVAPVRETCAQCLGHILSLAGEAVSSGVLGVLLVLLRCPQWEARHGGLLGLKYLLAVRKVGTA